METGEVIEQDSAEGLGFQIDAVDGRYYLVDKIRNVKQYYNLDTGEPDGEPVPLSEAELATQAAPTMDTGWVVVLATYLLESSNLTT